MKILLLGASSYLGARLYQDLDKDFEVLGTYHNTPFVDQYVQLDITNPAQIEAIVHQFSPDIIIHTANFPSPRNAEKDPEGYSRLNLHATQHIVDAANQINAKVIFISSFAALNPSDVYGELKLKSEEIIKTAVAGYLIVRPSLILGMSPNTQNDRPFNRVLKHAVQKTIAEFDTSWKFQPTYIGHLSAVISTAIHQDIFNQIVHVTCPSVQTQYSTARDILEPFEIEVKPIDRGMNIPLQEVGDQALIDLGFPTLSYAEMIEEIHREMKAFLQ